MRRFLIFLLISILIAALWYFFVVSPINERKDLAEADLETAQTEEFTLQTTLSRLKKIDENQLEYTTAIGHLEAGIPSTPRLAEIIDDLSLLADENGLAWTTGSYSLPTLIAGTEVYEVGVNVVVAGQFFEVLGYLYGIEEMDRIIRVNSVDLSPGTDDAGFHTMSATISGVAFTTSDVTVLFDAAALLEVAVESAAEAAAEAADEAAAEAGDEATTDESTTTTTEGS